MSRQAAIDDGLDYVLGWPQQHCAACGWASTTGHKDLPSCPRCAAQLEPPDTLAFGGILVTYRLNAFFVSSRSEAYCQVKIDEADAQDTITFMARRFEPCYGRSLPTLATIRELLHQALLALDAGHPDLCRQALVALEQELEPEGRGQ